MIPLYKLSGLPRSQKLRKAANLVRNAERRFVVSGQFEAKEADYFAKLIEMLAEDGVFSPYAHLGAALAEGKEIRRVLNTVHHLILTETGRYQADWDFYEAGGKLDAAKRRFFPGMYVYLEDIRSPFNVGSFFRTAESFGAEKIWLSPLSASPRHKRAERTAMGCLDILPWEQLKEDPFGTSSAGINSAGNNSDGIYSGDIFAGGPFFALETGGTPLEDFTFPPKGLLIAGSEELGVSPEALATADSSLGRVSIPTWGAKGSLNVSVAFGIVMQAWAKSLLFH